MRMKTLKGICVIAMTVAVLCGCERQEPKDAREAFVGNYTYTYLAPDSIPVYIDTMKVGSIPVEGEGEFSLVLGNAENELWMVEEGDTTLATVSGKTIYLEPVTTFVTYMGIDIETRYDYGTGVLTGNQIKWKVDAFMKGTYMGISMSGSGPMDLIATKKE